jgi:uncharacterized protein YecE (DUF72 family)
MTWPGDSYVYFNNDQFGHAIRDALDLSELVGGPRSGPRPPSSGTSADQKW